MNWLRARLLANILPTPGEKASKQYEYWERKSRQWLLQDKRLCERLAQILDFYENEDNNRYKNGKKNFRYHRARILRPLIHPYLETRHEVNGNYRITRYMRNDNDSNEM